MGKRLAVGVNWRHPTATTRGGSLRKSVKVSKCLVVPNGKHTIPSKGEQREQILGGGAEI